MTRTITLDGRTYPVNPIPLVRLKTLLPALNRFESGAAAAVQGQIDESLIDDLITILESGLGLPRAEAEQVTAPLYQVLAQLSVIVDMAGLRPVEPGKEPPVTDTTGTPSTPG